MGRPCKICKAGLEEKFEALAKQNISQRELARRLQVSHHNVRSHFGHANLSETSQAEDRSTPSLLNCVIAQSWRIQKRIQTAEKRGDYTTASKAESALAKNFELQAKLSGVQDSSPTESVSKAQIRSLMGVLATALHDHPDLKQRILMQISETAEIGHSNGAASAHS